MAKRSWLGNALPVAQVTTATPTAANSTVFTLACNGKSVSYTSDSSALASEITAGLLARFNIVKVLAPEWNELTCVDDGTKLTFTGADDGTPFTITSTGAGTIAVSTTTAATGPNHAGNTANWSGSALPVDGDDVEIANPVSIKYGLDELDDVTPASIKIYSSFWASGAIIGLPAIHRAGSTSYTEYRERFLYFLGATLVEIGIGESRGSTMLNLDFMTGDVAVTVHNTGTPNDPTRKTLALNMNPGAAADGKLEVLAGSVGVGMYGETCKCTSRIGFRTNQIGDALVSFGDGVTHGATNEMSGGTVEINSATTVINKTGGELTINGSGAHPSIFNWEGPLYYNSTGATIATKGVIGSKGVVSFDRDMSVKDIDGPWEMYEGATLSDRFGVCNAFIYKAMGCSPDRVNVIGKPDRTWTQS